jgi:hypothetical protein
VLPFLWACLIALTIFLWVAAGGEVTARDLLLTGLPAWLQGIGTVAAACIAWLAFAEWQRRERARRRAELAEKVLHAASELAFAIARARSARAIPADTPLRGIAAAYTGPESFQPIEELRAATGKLQVFALPAACILGPGASPCIHDCGDLASTLSRAHGKLSRIARGEAAPREDVVKVNLAICRGRTDENDEFGRDCTVAFEKLRATLAPHLSYDLNPANND